MKPLSLLADVLIMVCLSAMVTLGQDIRPGIECGCEEYEEYVGPKSKGILLEQGETVQEGSSKEGKYTVQAVEAIPPNTVTLTIRNKNGKSIYHETTSAAGWGFSSSEDRFVMHGYAEGGKHWCTLFNLNPDAGKTGEPADSWQVISPTQVSSARIRFSPHGHYLLYAAIDNNGYLFLRVFNTKTGVLAYDGSTSSPIVGLPDDESLAGWGFSSDPMDATFVHAFKTDATRYVMCVKELAAPPGEFVLKTNEIEGGSYWRFSPCGDVFLWIFNDPQGNPECRFYKTNQENTPACEPVTGVDFEKAKTEKDGHYILYESSTEWIWIFDNAANNPCDDNQAPTWSGATVDTTDVTGTSLQLHWSGASDNNDVTQYRVYLDGTEIKELEAIDHVEITGVTPKSTGEFRVEAGDAAGNWSTDGPSDDFTTRKDTFPEWSDGTSLIAETVEGTRVTLSWDEASDDWGIIFYKVYCNNSLCDKISGDTTCYTVTGLTPEETDTFRVEAGDAAGQWTENGPQAIVTLKADAPPYWLPEHQLTATDITETTMMLNWPEAKDDFGVRKYEILQDDKKIATRKYDTCYEVEGLEEGTMYHFKIIAYDDFQENVSDPPLQADLRTMAAFVEDSLAIRPGDQTDPDIDFNTVVWKDERNSQSDLYTYDLEEDIEKQFTSNTTFQGFPRVQGERIVWEDARTGNGDIYLYDPALDTIVICPDPEVQAVPDIYGDHVVWAQLKSGEPNNWDIYMYDLKTREKVTICDAPGKQTNPSISEKRVVWEDYRNGNADIYGHRINNYNNPNEFEICIEPSSQQNPVVTEESGWIPGCFRGPGRTLYYPGHSYYTISVVWQDDRNGDWDIYQCEITDDYLLPDIGSGMTDKKMPYNRSNQVNPHFYHNTMVFQDDKNGDWDIYAFQKEFGNWYSHLELEPICNASGDQIHPRTWGGRIVWEDYRHGDADIYIWDRPPGSDLKLKISESSDPVGINKMLEYTLIVRNDGPDMNENIGVTCSFPLKAKYEEHHVTKGTTSLQGNELQWNIDELRFDSIAVLTCEFTTYDLATLTFSAEAQGNAFDSDPSSNKVTEKTDVRYVIPAILGQGKDPDLTTAEDGHVHVVYFSRDSLIYAHKKNLGTWEAEKLAVLKEYTGQSCALTMDHQQKVHICYSTYDRDVYPPARLYHIWQDGEFQWHEKTIAVSDKGYAGMHLETDSQDEMYLAFRAAEEYIFYAPIKFMKTLNGEWTEPYMIEKEGYSDIDMVLDEQDKPHLSYYAVNKGIIYHYCQDPDANLWSAPEIIEDNWGGGQLEGMVTSISIDDSGIPHISYVGNVDQDSRENIKHAWKQGEHWSIEKIDDGDFGSSGNGVYVEEPGKVHFTYVHFPSHEIRYATNIAGPWIRQGIDDEIEDEWFNSTLINQDAKHHNHLVYEKDEYIYYALRRPIPVLKIHPDTLDFGSVPIDSTKKITVFLENPEKRSMTVDSAVIADHDCFEVEKTFGRLERGETDGMYVHFSPTSEGLYNTYLRIYYNAPSGMYMEIPILARSEMPLLKVKPDPVDFGAVQKKEQKVITVDIINEGEKELIFDEINVKKEFYGTVYPTDFSLLSNTCDVLTGGDSCEVSIAFEPESSGSQYSYLNIYSNDPMEPEKEVKITGHTPISRIEFSSSVIDFGYVEINNSATREFMIENTGEVDIEIFGIVAVQDPDLDQFEFEHNCTTIPSGESCPVTAHFKPTRSGDMEIEISIGSSANMQNIEHITVKGTTIERQLSISTHHVDFGILLPGEEISRIITFENEDTSKIQIETVELTGKDRLEFYCGFPTGSRVLSEGETFTDTVKFQPIFEGRKEAYVIVHSNDSDHPEDTITLTGIAGSVEVPLSLSIQADVTSGKVPLTVNFTSQVTGGSTPYSYSWDFGDGSTSTLAEPVHTFETSGNYRVILTVTDMDGDTDADTLFIDVSKEKYTLSGYIFDESGSSPINSSKVELFNKDNTEALLEKELTDTNGYAFTQLDSSMYTVCVIPDTMVHQNTLPTYLGDKLGRFEAGYVNLNKDYTNQDIHVIQRPEEGSGEGSIEGTFSESNSGEKSSISIGSAKADGAPVADCYVYLNEETSGVLKAFDITAGDGSFAFKKLATGSYQFYTDYKGLPMDEANETLEVSESDEPLKISVVANEAGIVVEIIATNIDDISKDKLLVYPIPARDRIKIQSGYIFGNFDQVQVKITDLAGKSLYQNRSVQWIGTGLDIDIGDLHEGVYILTIQLDQMKYQVKIMKMK